jgi:hypothetical protein
MSAMTSKERPRTPGLITPIAVTYVALGLLAALAAICGVRVGSIQMSVMDAILPLLLSLAGVGAYFRQTWGRWTCYFFSAILLLGVPIGTILGVLMIYHLTIYRGQFSRGRASLHQA